MYKQVSHKLYSAMQRRKQQQKARSLWQAEYPREPFHVELNSDLFYTDDDLPSRLSYDIMAAATRQRTFYYQVIGERREKGGLETEEGRQREREGGGGGEGERESKSVVVERQRGERRWGERASERERERFGGSDDKYSKRVNFVVFVGLASV